MNKTVCVIQARMGSTRLPGKVLKDISGVPTLWWVTEAAKRASGIDEVIIATTAKERDQPIREWADANDMPCILGSEEDVVSRYMKVAKFTGANIIVRLTGDCPFLDPNVISEVIQLRKMKDVMYATNTDPPSYPDGLDVEVFTREALEQVNREADRPSDRDTVTRYMVRNRHRISAANLTCPLPYLVRERWVLDSPEDYEFVCEIAERLTRTPPRYLDILNILEREPWLREINSKFQRNERFYDTLALEGSQPKRSYSISKACLARAEGLIPLGAQTFSKSKLQFPEGAAPLFVTHGHGGYVYDVDGNEYVDLVGGLLPNILGYCDPDVDAAIRRQLDRGISFSLATTLETDLAERLNFHIPSAEMVRFGKNGSDVTTAAVRLARHITKGQEIAVGGYHGWHSWSVAHTERAGGVTSGEGESSTRFTKFDKHTIFAGTAAVILEPEFFSQAELIEIRKQCSDQGALLIFDEIISGFRCGMGGLQKVTGVTPDLSCFGKAMANGMPISALVGKKEYMERMPEISYSGTFFGETLSIAASIATIDKLYKYNVPRYLWDMGGSLRSEINVLLHKHSVPTIQIFGEVELNRIKFENKQIQSLFIQEMAKNGVLIIGSHNTCYAHKKTELDRILTAWDRTLKVMSEGGQMDGGIIQGEAVR